MWRFFLFLVLILTVAAVCFAFQIIFTSDLHESLVKNGMGPYGLVDYLSNTDRSRVLVLDSGDIFDSKLQLPFLGDNRESVLRYIQKVNYDAMVLGNHEYYFSHEWLEIYKRINKSLIGANVQDLEPFHIFEIDGMKIAVIGLTTIQHLANQIEHAQNLPSDPLEALKKTLRILPKVDYIICLNHLPHEIDIKILELFPKVDLVLSGHDHRGPELKKIKEGYLFEAASHAESVYLLDVNPTQRVVTYRQLGLMTDYVIQNDNTGMLLLIGTIVGILSLLWVLF